MPSRETEGAASNHFEDTVPGAMIAAVLTLLLIVLAVVAMDWIVG